MKVFLLAAMIAGSVPAFASSDFSQSAVTPAEQEAVNEGLIPADQLDAAEYQTEATLVDRDHRGDRDRDRDRRDDRDRRRWPRRPMPPRQERWQCVARDRIQRSYRGDGWNVNDARREAMRDCQRGSIVGRCRLVGCARR